MVLIRIVFSLGLGVNNSNNIVLCLVKYVPQSVFFFRLCLLLRQRYLRIVQLVDITVCWT